MLDLSGWGEEVGGVKTRTNPLHFKCNGFTIYSKLNEILQFIFSVFFICDV